MTNLSTTLRFNQEIDKKYQVFNSLFMSLPYEKMENIGTLLPFFYEHSQKGFEAGKTPIAIIDSFFAKHTEIHDRSRINDLLFVMIQYVERQIVLFDSIEDAAFEMLHHQDQHGRLNSIYQICNDAESKQRVLDRLRNFKVRVVFTAHPTQFYPDTVLSIIHEMEQAIQHNDLNWIDTLLQQLGRTPFINRDKPTPLEEAKSILYYLRNVYYDAIGEIHDSLYAHLAYEPEAFSPVLMLGFWPGGDRDGNPFVTTKTTQAVSNELRYTILKCYYQHLKKLAHRLTFKDVFEKLNALLDLVYVNMFGQKHNLNLSLFWEKITEIRDTLIQQHDGFFIHYLDQFIRRVKIFGLHFASLDIRQDSSVHQALLEAIVQQFSQNGTAYSAMSFEERLHFLTTLNLRINPSEFEDAVFKDTLENIQQLSHIQAQNGERACHRYIISNTTSIWQVLEVLALFRFVGYAPEEIHFDIIPLFETVEGMNNAATVMSTLYQLPFYQEHLARRGNQQTIMLGFSDGTKDGGYVKANWGIYQTKERLTEVSKEHGIEVIFFDGRGGPPARGGGKTHQFYDAQGSTIANHEIQLTIQGQTITSIYGSKPQATYNFEQLISVGILPILLQNTERELSPNHRALIERIAEISFTKYSALKAHPQFLDYLSEMSTLKYYGKTNIGSRPTKRGKKTKLTLKDLRAIPFVGSWAQLRQNVPGYYGFGTALKMLIDEGKLADLQDLFNHSLFFKTLMSNSMMSLSKSYFPLTKYMTKNEKFSAFWQLLYEEYDLSKQTMMAVSEYPTLMADSELSELSVEYREKIVLPLLTIQQYALTMLEHATTEEEKLIYEKMIVRSMFGNINASRNAA